MKTFINVLYRRILYKIPLKLLLILLAVFAVLFACTKADNVSSLVNYLEDTTVTIPGKSYVTLKQLSSSDYGDYCFYVYYNSQNTNSYVNIGFDYRTNALQNGLYASIWQDSLPNTFCMHMNLEYILAYNYYSTPTTISYKLYRLDTLLNTQIPVYSSMQCQTTYNLIPISSVDSNYCTTNNLCPSQECPDSPSGTGDLTQLYINNILHVGAPTILMNIPDEIDWDYAYTMGGNIMNIDIVGYNVDYQVVEDEITIQKYKPSTEELSSIISGLIPLFVPGLCIILLLYFIFKFIKKVF